LRTRDHKKRRSIYPSKSLRQPELATDSEKLRKAVSELASKRAGWIVALAKSKMLDDFGEEEAADAILKPYVLEGE